MRPHTRTHCAKKGDCEEHAQAGPGGVSADTRCVARRGDVSGGGGGGRQIALVELPAEILIKILQYMSYKEISAVRRISRRLNELCAARLNTTFQRLQSQMLVRFQTIKSQMPRRESARRNHPLARECDIIETLHMRLTLLQMTFGKHIERKHICFFPGEILDEVFRILNYVASTNPPGRAYKVTDELFDLSTMAMEYFKENIEPSLPEITYFGSDFLEFTPPFATPSKRLSTGIGFDSPMSSRASAVGSSCSEPPLPYNTLENEYEEMSTSGREVAPQSNMVLRKRIRRIRAGMKKYNTQLDEVKRELKTTKSKMDSQTKQVSEYASRMDDYDKKFEENSRKFGTLLAELNKCKTELQYYRSRSHLMQCLNCGSSMAETSDNNGPGDSHDIGPPEVGLSSVDKQAMVEDWLNPEQGETVAPGDGETREMMAPQVQHRPGLPETEHNYPKPGTSAQQKISKTADETYLRTGPGSPGYTRASPRSPGPGTASASAGTSGTGSGAGNCSGSRAGKRKSRDPSVTPGVPGSSGSSNSVSSASNPKNTRCKRPKVGHSN